MATYTVAGASGNVKQEKNKRKHFAWDLATAFDKTEKFKDSFPSAALF